MSAIPAGKQEGGIRVNDRSTHTVHVLNRRSVPVPRSLFGVRQPQPIQTPMDPTTPFPRWNKPHPTPGLGPPHPYYPHRNSPMFTRLACPPEIPRASALQRHGIGQLAENLGVAERPRKQVAAGGSSISRHSRRSSSTR